MSLNVETTLELFVVQRLVLRMSDISDQFFELSIEMHNSIKYVHYFTENYASNESTIS